MKIKWYLSTLVIVLSFLGICHNQISSPNQEILLQFNSEDVTLEQSENAIASIKKQLQYFGVDSFHISDCGNGELRISYHSSIDVEIIKQSLSQNELGLDLAAMIQKEEGKKSPSKDHFRDYNLDVYEIQKTSEGNNSAGKFAIVVKQDYDPFSKSISFPSFNQTNFSQSIVVEKLSNNSFQDIAFAINNTSLIIPEVRAGPISATS